MRNFAGIVSAGTTVRDGYPLVQSRCHYDILDVYTIANVVQDYVAAGFSARNVEYVFPLPPSAAVCSFKAVIDDDKVIKGVVKEKGDARREFDNAVAQGKTAGLLQQEHADVFRVSLGNIKPNQKISVHISFVSIILHDGDSPQSLRTTMPTAIAPRYGVPPPGIPWFGKNRTNRFDLTVAIQMSKPITSVTSPTHLIGLTLGCAEKELRGDFDSTKAFIHLGDAAFLDRDIVIVISSQGLDVPRCSVERWLASEGAEETTDAYALTLVPKFDLPALPSQEYIFLVDRSGSMAGTRMEAVKTSLQIMLRSLPSNNTTFNIVSFGSHYTSLWGKSQLYSAETVAEASKHVDTFTASYGGTEMAHALQFAFSTPLYLDPSHTAQTQPASVFILTDGESWDLRGVVEIVTERIEAAKTQNKLLRTFVLGVGNQVSTAMCEGIARAGRGTAVFVATGEKPDAKLLSLLKAARGGLIEDLTVNWGTSEFIKGTDDGFELVSGPSTSGQSAPAPQSELPAINLFDEQTSSTDNAEVGPNKMVVQLPPPPTVQQAPRSDKLPIPLYPGFRCSIFAIVKQSSNPGPHSTIVKITGKVMGREVTFQTPVIPRTIGLGVTSKAMESEKLLHTLAAKALIQVYEDMPSSPETKAQIERLGKRYSLASSVTSFLAVDEQSRSELRHEVYQFLPQGSSGTASQHILRARQPWSIYSTKSPDMTTGSPNQPVQYQQQQKGQQQQHKEHDPFIEPYDPTITDDLDTTYVGQEEYSAMRATPFAVPKDSSHDSYESYRRVGSQGVDMSLSEMGGGAARPKSHSILTSLRSRKKRSSTSSIPDSPKSSGPSRLSMMISSRFTSSGSQATSVGPASTSAGPLTLESIVRVQQFSGSFPNDPTFLERLCGGKPVPAMSAQLRQFHGGGKVERVKNDIWATVLVLACLKRTFASEKDSWEVVAEKATAFIKGALQPMIPRDSDLSEVIEGLIAEAESRL